jgi:hypothetical protein
MASRRAVNSAAPTWPLVVLLVSPFMRLGHREVGVVLVMEVRGGRSLKA